MNCLFTMVNAGTGQLDYLTPQACGVFVPQNNVTSSSSSSTLKILANNLENLAY